MLYFEIILNGLLFLYGLWYLQNLVTRIQIIQTHM